MDPYKIILQQLGGNKFKIMTGAKNLGFADDGFSLSMKIGRNSKGITHIKIFLNALDTYNMTFYAIRKHQLVTKSVVSGVYCDMLQEIFTKHTGLNTHL